MKHFTEDNYKLLKQTLETQQLSYNLEIKHISWWQAGKNYQGEDRSKFYPFYGLPIIEIYIDSNDLSNNPMHKIGTLCHEYGHYVSYVKNGCKPTKRSIAEEIKAWFFGLQLLYNMDFDIIFLIPFFANSIFSHVKHHIKIIYETG